MIAVRGPGRPRTVVLILHLQRSKDPNLLPSALAFPALPDGLLGDPLHAQDP